MNAPSTKIDERDYDRVAIAIQFLQDNYAKQPSLDEVAAQVHLSPHHFQKLFSRWAGVSPKKFLEALTLTAAKKELRANIKPLLQVSEELGLGSSSRLHDHFVHLEGVTPDQYRRYGRGMQIAYGLAPTPFGFAWIASTERGICHVWFRDLMNEEDFVGQLKDDWPDADLMPDDNQAREFAARIFPTSLVPDKPISLLVKGTNFQISVWNALLRVPYGSLATYAGIAEAIGNPKAVRAVGSAVGDNPVAFLIPCHRVIRADGGLGGYRGGLIRKKAMMAWEQLQSS